MRCIRLILDEDMVPCITHVVIIMYPNNYTFYAHDNLSVLLPPKALMSGPFMGNLIY